MKAPIRFTFDERKAAEAAAFFLKRRGGRMHYMVLVKLLYLAEREALSRFNRPLCGDACYAMRYGPVLSRVLRLVKEEKRTEGGPWRKAIGRNPGERFGVRLLSDPGLKALSKAEVQVLKDVQARYEKLDQWKLSDLTHRLPEWKNPGRTSILIHPEEILEAAGKGREEIEELRQYAREREYFGRMFGVN